MMRVVRVIASLFLVLTAPTAIAGRDALLSNTSIEERIHEYRGKIVVLNFWATWCKPCRAEITTLIKVQRHFSTQGVQVIGASIDEPEDRKAAEKFVREMGINYPVWFQFTTEHMLPLRLATSIPATAVFDDNGQRVFRIIGEATQRDLVERLEWLLGDRTAPAPAELVLPAGITPEHFKEHEEGKEDEHQEEVAQEAGSAVPS